MSAQGSDRLEVLTSEIREFNQARDWGLFHDPKNLAMALAVEVGELVAEFRWVENSRADESVRDSPRRERVVEEIGDVAIVLLTLCDRIGIDLVGAARQKLERNAENYPTDRARGQPDRV